MKRFEATSGLKIREPLLFEVSEPGRVGCSLPASCTEAQGEAELPTHLLRARAPAWPEISEPEAVRHFVRLSQQNYAIDVGFFPLGSCTMKYNPKINEDAARIPAFWAQHPLAPVDWIQGQLEIYWQLERYLAEISGFDAITLQPAAGAHGEFTALSMFRAHLIATEGRPRTKILVPDTAHGTNPASCTLNGYESVPIASSSTGVLDPAVVAAVMDEDTAGIMVTNPNTLGLFERHIAEIAEIVHAKGGLVYCDGANLNSLLGRGRPGDMGVDAMHFNLHKTFSTPHGGGGPGSGPVGVARHLEPYLPIPRVERIGVDGVRADGVGVEGSGLEGSQTADSAPGTARYRVVTDRPLSIGRVKAFLGNFGMHVRAWTYIRELGPKGLKLATDMAVLNANYLRVRLGETYHVAYDQTCMHEVVLTDRNQRKDTGVDTRDIAKALIDRGFHPPTVFFPICVQNAIMIEPTETEALSTLDAFIEAMEDIDRQARSEPEALRAAPTRTIVGRLDETRAVRKPVLRWRPEPSDSSSAS